LRIRQPACFSPHAERVHFAASRLCDNILIRDFPRGERLAHISRKELKKDELRETLAQGADAVLSHKLFTTYLLLAGIVVALSVFGWKTYADRQTMKAAAAYDEAMKSYQARIRTASEPTLPGETTYFDDNNKYSDAAKKFAEVATKYSHTRPGQLAAYYAALSDEKLGKMDDAKKWLQGLASAGNDDFASMARFELAQINDRQGQGDEAVKLYQQLIAKPTVLVPKPVVMLALAEHYGAKNPTEASRLYSQIKSEYPDTPIAQQADQELNLLPGKT
jgi:predicted negative regulator of RcsB-dependent stress response